MSSIRILSDRVANQIAAGEVIERPVAVVKELVENSIDSGATRIEVEFRNGGKSYIRIEDNGKGMTPDEALLSLERHATSKIQEAADLNEVSSFGFRGEALPSIASVSKFTMRTRAEGWEHGTEIIINGGKLLSKKDCGMPVGTVIEVANLFNSVPARRKFLKTDPTETAHITYNSRLFAVAHPHVAFRVLEGGRTVFQSPSCETLSERIAEIWGRSLSEDLIIVNQQDTARGYCLTGLTAKPGVGRSTRRELVTLVNRRPVDSRTLGFAVLDAYHGRIQKGRYPPAFLFLTIRPQDVDVNVHPAKREVRFRDDGAVRRFVLNAITQTLADHRDEMKRPKITNQPKATSSLAQPHRQEGLPPESPKVTITPSPSAQPSPQTVPQAAIPAVQPDSDASVDFPSTNTPLKSNPEWRLISRVQQRYALFETEKGIVMLHLRHADQRVRFERICKDFNSEAVTSQRLLIPHPIEFEPLASEALNSQLQLLNEQGFEIELFGRQFYRICAVPIWLQEQQAENFLRDFVDLIRQRGEIRKSPTIAWKAIARLAIDGSYQKNDKITDAGVQTLANDLLTCDSPHTSPSGKPTYSEISWTEWQRRFGTTND